MRVRWGFTSSAARTPAPPEISGRSPLVKRSTRMGVPLVRGPAWRPRVNPLWGQPPGGSWRYGVPMPSKKIFGIVLAGGEGKRLMPLTEDRAKPAVPFGGVYRLVDFALSNLINSGILRIAVLTQYKSHSLDRHISTTWRLSNLLGNYVTPV